MYITNAQCLMISKQNLENSTFILMYLLSQKPKKIFIEFPKE